MQDQIIPKRQWEFDKDVTECFDDMLERSIPQYQLMRDLCFEIGRKYVQHRTDIVDIGCSRGGAIRQFVTEYGAHNHFIGLERSESMISAAQKIFEGMINCSVVEIRNHDLRKALPFFKASLVLSILTIQFTPIEYRQRIIQDVFDRLLPGGAFLFVEKVLGENSSLNEVLIDTYLNMKKNNGYSEDQIERKKMSLEGILVPVTGKWNEELLKMAGFKKIDCFWRCLNFSGWIAVK